MTKPLNPKSFIFYQIKDLGFRPPTQVPHLCNPLRIANPNSSTGFRIYDIDTQEEDRLPYILNPISQSRI